MSGRLLDNQVFSRYYCFLEMAAGCTKPAVIFMQEEPFVILLGCILIDTAVNIVLLYLRMVQPGAANRIFWIEKISTLPDVAPRVPFWYTLQICIRLCSGGF